MSDSNPTRSRVNLRKQMGEITRLRQEMSAKPPDQWRTTTRSAPPANVRKLVSHAERACHAAQSLRHPVPVRLSATLNQQPLA